MNKARVLEIEAYLFLAFSDVMDITRLPGVSACGRTLDFKNPSPLATKINGRNWNRCPKATAMFDPIQNYSCPWL
jgi:hypothetical protein